MRRPVALGWHGPGPPAQLAAQGSADPGRKDASLRRGDSDGRPGRGVGQGKMCYITLLFYSRAGQDVLYYTTFYALYYTIASGASHPAARAPPARERGAGARDESGPIRKFNAKPVGLLVWHWFGI